MDSTDLISVQDLAPRINVTPRRLAFLIRTKVLIPEVVTRDGMFWHRRNIWSIRETVQKFSGL